MNETDGETVTLRAKRDAILYGVIYRTGDVFEVAPEVADAPARAGDMQAELPDTFERAPFPPAPPDVEDVHIIYG